MKGIECQHFMLKSASQSFFFMFSCFCVMFVDSVPCCVHRLSIICSCRGSDLRSWWHNGHENCASWQRIDLPTLQVHMLSICWHVHFLCPSLSSHKGFWKCQETKVVSTWWNSERRCARVCFVHALWQLRRLWGWMLTTMVMRSSNTALTHIRRQSLLRTDILLDLTSYLTVHYLLSPCTL